MSDFFDDVVVEGVSEGQGAQPAVVEAQPAQVETTPAVSAEQFSDLQRRLDASERWRQDFGRMVAENTGVMPQAAQKQSPEDILTQFVQDPLGFQEKTISEATRLARQEMEQQSIVQDRRAKHPELAQLEQFIDWNSAMQAAGDQFYKQNGRHASFAEALDASIAMVKGNLQGVTSANQVQNQAQGATRMAMNLSLTGGQPTQPQKPDLFAMSDSEWVKYRDSVMRQAQGY